MQVVVSGEVVAALEAVVPAEDVQVAAHAQLLSLEEVLGVGLPGLVEGEVLGELLPAEGDREGIFSGVGEGDFPDLYGVVGEEVVDDEGRALEAGVELEHLAVVLEELLLGVDLAAAQLLLEVVLHLRVLLRHPLVGERGSPLVVVVGLGRPLRLAGALVELAGVVIAVVEVDGAAVERDRLADAQVVGSQELAVLLHVLLPLQELALRDARVLEFLLVDGDGVVLEVEEHLHLAVAAVLLVALDHALLEVAEEAQDVAVEVHPVGLVELGGVAGRVFGVEVVV